METPTFNVSALPDFPLHIEDSALVNILMDDM